MHATMIIMGIMAFIAISMAAKPLHFAYEMQQASDCMKPESERGKIKNFMAFARISLGSNLDAIRGKLGGVVYSQSRSVATQRKRLKPRNPQTPYQTAIRANMSQYSKSWADLTDNQRNSWIAAAKTFTKKNIFGGTYNTTGNKLFVAYNMEATLNGLGSQIATYFVPTPPTTIIQGSGLTASAGAQTMTFTATNAAPTNGVCVIEATPQLSAGISNITGKFKVISRSAVAASALVIGNCASAYIAKFGPLIQGQKIWVKIYTSNNNAAGQVTKYPASAIMVCTVGA